MLFLQSPAPGSFFGIHFAAKKIQACSLHDPGVLMRDKTDSQIRDLGEVQPSRSVTELLAPMTHLDALLQSFGDGIVFLDPAHHILYVNPAGAALLEYPVNHLVGRPLSSILEAGKKDSLVRALKTLASREGVDTEQLVYPYRDRTFHLTLTNVLADGRYAGQLLLVRDGSGPARRIEELAALNELATMLTSTLDLNALLCLIMARIQALMGVEASSLLLKDERKDELVFQVGLGEHGTAVQGRRLKGDQGIAGWVFRHGVPLIVPDARKDDRFFRGIDKETGFRTKSVLCVPLKAREKIIGVIQVLNCPTDRAFTEDDLNLLSAIAAHAATAIENARLFQETETRAKKLGALAKVSGAVTATLDLQHIFELIIHASSELLNTPVASLWTLEGEELTLREGLGLDSELWDRHFRLIERLVAWIARQKQPVVISEFAEDPPIEHEPWVLAEGVHAVAGFPLRVGKRCLGVLTVFRTSPQPFEPDDVELLSAFANQAAVAVDHAKLYQELRDHSSNLERKVRDRTEEFRRRSAELERANRSKSESLVTICRELQTSLKTVVASSQRLKQYRLGGSATKHLTDVTHISSRARHLLAFINNLADICRVDAGKLELHPEVIQVSEMLLAVLAELRPQADAKGLHVAVDVKECRSTLMADPFRLKQILQNLLSNAIKFTPAGGRITVGASSHGESVQVSVSDTGIGIKAEDLPKVLERFPHLETVSSPDHPGTRLGLALSKHLTELHGGTIRAESGGEGQGSTFTITLPLQSLATRPGPV